MYNTINPNTMLSLDQSIAQLGHSLKNLESAALEYRNKMRMNGAVDIYPFKGKEENHHSDELTIGDYEYLVLFDVEYIQYRYEPDEPVITILRVQRVHITEGDEYETLHLIERDLYDTILQELNERWEQSGRNSYDNTGCPVNDDTKDY